MRRRFIIALLALGTVGGYASGFASLRYRSHCRSVWTEARARHTCPPCPASVVSAEAPPPPQPR